MCGIMGYKGAEQALPIIIKGLQRLEYRGYDSAGIAVSDEKDITLHKEKGNMAKLTSTMPGIPGTRGIGHTRWATHGVPSKENAHPHMDSTGSLAVVHNGIIDNYQELKESLQSDGTVFRSETDTEVIPHLISKYYKGDLKEAVADAIKELRGSYAIAVVSTEDDRVIGARLDSPMILAIGDDGYFLASDVPAILDYTNKIVYLENNDIVSIESDRYTIWDGEGNEVEREVKMVDFTVQDAEKGGYPHFMLKEIYEQPSALHKSILSLPAATGAASVYRGRYDSVKIIACGTSYHAGLIGKYLIEDMAKIPVSVEMASEYRYSTPPMGNPLVILVTQSGETADTVAAAREAHIRGRNTLVITNVVGSSITREVSDVVYTRAGIEIGVAASKTFSAQVLAFYSIAMNLSIARKRMNHDEAREARQHIRTIPRMVQKVLDSAPLIEEKVAMFKDAYSAFFIGRNINYPIALEGALKMKEISYIHAEGYPSGELKHGPLALLTDKTPVVAIAMRDHTYDKMIGNMGEVSARKAPILAIGDENDPDLAKYADEVLLIPHTPPIYSPILVGVVLQLLAYYVARDRDCEIDKPRNLAKSVTVE